MIAVVAIVATGLGVALGLLGGGGSVLAVPLFLTVLDLDPRDAIAASLLVVGGTSAVCAFRHKRVGNVNTPVGLVFGGLGMVGGFFGGNLAAYIPAGVLLGGFAAMMVASGVAMIRGRRPTQPSSVGQRSLGRAGLIGLLVGVATGLVGAGGGFMIVPALVMFAGLPMKQAVGTSTLVITMQALAAYAGHAGHTSLELTQVGPVLAFAAAGAVVGTSLVRRIDPTHLRKAFGWLVLAAAIPMIATAL